MGRNLRIMKAYVVVQCISGLGDQYSSLLSASVIKSELDRMGYDVYLLWNVRSLYMPSDYPLDFLFDLTSFGPVEYNLEEAIKKEYHLLPQIQQSIRIYVSEINLFLQEYQSTFYDHSSFRRLGSNIPIFKKQYLSKEVLEIKNRFLEGKKEIYGIHFRVGDSFLNTPIELLEPYRNSIEEVETFIKENPSTEIMICSKTKHFLPIYQTSTLTYLIIILVMIFKVITLTKDLEKDL